MPGTKRSASPSADARVAKASKFDEKGTATSKKVKPIARSTFRSEALPVHVSFTHTPPAVPENESEKEAPIDPGHIGSLTLLPTDFSTGSYGWKGARRLTIELQGDEGEEKKTVQVMININATVVGSKGATEGDDAAAKEGTSGDEAEESGTEK